MKGYTWKLKKPLYGLNDASKKFWLRVKNVFTQIGLRRLEDDEVVYYMLNEKGDMDGIVFTHVDDFDLAGTQRFVEEVTKKISAALDVSQVENDHFRFTGKDVMKV